MMATWQKAVSSASPELLASGKTNGAIQTELLFKDATTQISVCGMSERIFLKIESDCKQDCGSCDQIDELLYLVAELQEEELDKPNRGEALLDLVLTAADEPIKEVKTGGSLGCSNRALIEFVISRIVTLVRSKVKTLNLARENFQLFKKLVKEVLLKSLHLDVPVAFARSEIFLKCKVDTQEKYHQDILKRPKQQKKPYWQLQKIRELWLNDPKMSEAERQSKESAQADRSLFVQELLLSTLMQEESSSSDEDERGEIADFGAMGCVDIMPLDVALENLNLKENNKRNEPPL
ncbi:hypothetical protein TURU_014342 [Turdus rufiventris]|nr:hypothetical protein TURU_014342 [Turdus rufiventris]